jgi:hypothetical protein
VDEITLEMHICDQRRSYLVTFEGPNAEAWALRYIEARGSTHAVHEVEDKPFDVDKYPTLYDLLYPTCEHGLSAWLCEGPQHYPYDNDERRAYGL